jgi:hypothetical protein
LGVEERVFFHLDGALPDGFEKILSGETRVEVKTGVGVADLAYVMLWDQEI